VPKIRLLHSHVCSKVSHEDSKAGKQQSAAVLPSLLPDLLSPRPQRRMLNPSNEYWRLGPRYGTKNSLRHFDHSFHKVYGIEIVQNLALIFDSSCLWVALVSKQNNMYGIENISVECWWSACVLHKFGAVHSTHLWELAAKNCLQKWPGKISWVIDLGVHCLILLKCGRLVHFWPIEATEWLKSTLGQIQDGRRCPSWLNC